MKKKYLLVSKIAAFLGLLIFIASCASSPKKSNFYSDNVKDFSTQSLSNGIPVIFKQNHGSKIIVLRMIFEGGSSVINENLGGIEDAVLQLMLHGSQKYLYEDIQKREYEKSFSLTSSAGRDFSTAGFTCIQRDLDEVLSIFSDGLLNPLFKNEDYAQLMAEYETSIAKKNSDPSGTLGLAVSKAAFSGTPYSTPVSVTKETFPSITLEKIEEHHKSLLNASRIKIVVVGNFNSELMKDFISELDKYFGNIEKLDFKIPEIPELKPGKNVYAANAQAGDTGYITGLFKCPERNSSDYIPFAIASMYIDDLFFSIVREKHGALYSIGSGVIGGKKLLGAISLYKATEKEHLKEFTFEAISAFDEKSVSEKLAQYKNKYITSLFSSSQTVSGVASSVISSMEYLGSETEYLKRSELVEKVTAKQVVAAYKKYFEPVVKENAIQWIVVDGEENLKKYDF